jgi:hypothetical protein
MRKELLDEAVAVRADFQGGAVTPVAFRRGAREHRVARVNARWIDDPGHLTTKSFLVMLRPAASRR